MNHRLPNVTEVASAIEIVSNNASQLTDNDLQLLAVVLRSSYLETSEFDDLSDEYLDSTDDARDLQQDVVVALSHLQYGSADWIVPDLIGYYDSDDQFYELAHAMISLSFPLTSEVEERFLLGTMQRDVLNAILRNDAILRRDATFADHLIAHGIPTNRDSIAKLVANAENAE